MADDVIFAPPRHCDVDFGCDKEVIWANNVGDPFMCIVSEMGPF